MKKTGLLATLLIGSLLLTGCNNDVKVEDEIVESDATINAENETNLETEEGRIAACEVRAGTMLNFNEGTFTWEEESEGGASFIRNGHVAYLKWGENAEDDVQCIIDMVDGSVNVKLSNHMYNGELQVTEEAEVQEAQTYTIVGLGEGFDEQIQAGQLVIRGEFEDHADVIFIEQSMWQNYVDAHKMVYGDEVVFKGELSEIDGAAGTHYYNADSIEQLEELFTVEVAE